MHPDALNLIQQDCARVADNSARLAALRGEQVLITGGTGFMGTWLVELLSYLNDQHGFGVKMHVLATQTEAFAQRAPHLAQRSDVTLLRQDVRHVADWPEAVGWIIHAAGTPDNRQHASNPLRVMQTITQGTTAALEAATRLPELKKFLHISSCLIYGPQPWELAAMPETFAAGLDCASVNAAYPEAKRFAETLCATYRNQQRLPIVVARPFAFIGPYQLLDRPWAVNNFIRDSLQGGAIRILGDGETVRSYMYASDMAWWLLCMLVEGTTGKSFNLGSPHEITLAHLAEKVAANFAARPKILLSVSSDRSLRRSKLVPDVHLAQSTLNLPVTVDLDTAIQRTLLWNQLQLRPA
jgi:nucleoside-diphosphate-sugar epimerase